MAATIAAGVDLATHCRIAAWIGAGIARLPPIASMVRFDSARLGCFDGSCVVVADLAGVQFTLPDAPGVNFRARRVRYCPKDGVEIEDGVLQGSTPASLMSFGRMQLRPTGNGVSARIQRVAIAALATVESVEFEAEAASNQIRVTKTVVTSVHVPDGVVRIDSVSLPALVMPRTPQPRIAVPLVKVGTSNTKLEHLPDGSWNLPPAADVTALTSQLQAVGDGLKASYSATSARLHSGSWWLVLVAFVVVATLKLALTGAALWLRAISAAITAGIAWALDLMGLGSVVPCLVAGAAVGIGLFLVVYRHSPEWHQRLEPAVVDFIAPLLIVFSLAAHRFVFPALPASPTGLDVAEIQLGETGVSVRDQHVGVASIGLASATVGKVSLNGGPRVTIDRAQVTDTLVSTTEPPARVQIPMTAALGISYAPSAPLALSVLANGTAESPGVTRSLQSIRYLPDAIRNPGPTPFCVSFQLGTELPAGCGGVTTISIRASADLTDPVRIRYAADVVTRVAGAGITVIAAGNGPHIRLTRIRSTPNSTVTIGGGSGTVKIEGGASAQFDLQGIEASGVRTENLGMRIGGSSVSRLDIHAEARGVRSPAASIRAVDFELRRDRRTVQSRLEARDVQVRGDQSIDTSLPATSADISGDWFDGRFVGALALSTTGAAVRPVRLTADPVAGTFQLANQVFELNQTSALFLPSKVTGHIRAVAAIHSLSPFDGSFHAGVELDRQAIRLLPAETTLEELKVTAGGNSPIAFDALFSAAFPKIPATLDWQEVSKLNLKTEGSWRGTEFDANAIPSWTPRRLPEQFRVSGALGAPTSIVTPAGRLEIGKATGHIQKLVLRNGRLKQLAIHAEFRELRTPAGPAGLVLNSDISLPAREAEISISGTASGVDSFAVSGGPEQLTFKATGIHTAVLWAAARPLLQEFGADAPWLHPEAQVRNVAGEVGFSQGRLARATANLLIEPGGLAGMVLKTPLRGLQVESSEPVALRASLTPSSAGPLGLEVATASPSVLVRLDGETGRTRATFGVEAEVKATLRFDETGRPPIVQAAVDTFEALRPHIQAAADTFGNTSGTLDWRVHLEGAPGSPAVTMGFDRWSATFGSAALDFSSQGTIVRGSGRIDADVVLHRDALVLDGRVPMHVEYSLTDGALQSAELDLPLLVAVTRQTPVPATGADELWSGADFGKILDDFTPRNATSVAFERPAIVTSLGEIRQIRIPLPVRLIIGATNPLRIGFPLAGNLLFGSLKGDGQAQVTWNQTGVCVTSRLSGSMDGLATDSIRAALQGMTSAAIRDVWDSKFSLGLNDLCLNRHRLAVLVWDPISSDLIDRMNLRLRVTRAEHGESVPGVLQFTAAADLKRVNQVLRDLIRQYQWESMPEAIRYSQFDLTFETQGDLVVNRGPLLTIGGIYFTDGRIATGADLRLHLRPSRGDHASVRDLIEMLRSFQ